MQNRPSSLVIAPPVPQAAAEAVRVLPARASAGWYWQTDSRHRVVHLFGNPTSSSAMGKRPWEIAGIDTAHPGWITLFDAMMARRPFLDAAWRRRDAAGRLHECLVSGEPVFGPKGRFVGFRGVGRDLTEFA